MNTKPPILVVEDDREIGALVRDLLEREGFEVRLARSGREMDESLKREGRPRLIILDLMLPGEDGLSICRRLQADRRMPILILTAKRDEMDRIIGLELGADDYLGKPFNPRELLARVRAILRRSSESEAVRPPEGCLRFAGYVFDVYARQLSRSSGDPIELLSAEYELLCALTEHPQQVLTRDQLMDWTRGRNWEAFDRSIDVTISRLRRKIEPDPARPSLIKTVRNGGYLFTAQVER